MASKKELYIPVNVPEREDFISGFGGKELTITGISLLIGIIVAAVIFVQTDAAFYAVGATGIIVALTIVLVRRDQFDESIIDKLRFVRLYHKAQKQFNYEYFNLYESREEVEATDGKESKK